MRKLSQLGEPMQMAYVPRDFKAALRFWTETMGVGPFYLQPNLAPPGLRHRGVPTSAVFSIAIAYWGDMQIELIEQHNDAPSIFTDWLGAGGDGLHHSCILVDDIEEARRVVGEGGGTIAQEIPGDGWGVLYVEMGGGNGTMVEIMQPSAATLGRFARMKAEAQAWDGSRPLRTFD